MVKRRNLKPAPEKAMRDLVRRLADVGKDQTTVPSGVKDLGDSGDVTWPGVGPDGLPASWSVRSLPAQIDEARETIEAAEGDIEAAKQAIADERAAREAALADAQAALDDLDERLNAAPDDAALQAIRDDLAAARAEVEAAAGVADDAAAAAATANANALAAAGIAADKGRIIYAPEKPTDPDDQSTSNLWIDSDDGRVYVWDETAGDWIESENESLRDAAQAAAAALQAAEAADAKASDAADSAAAAQSAAEAAQTTADEATIDARDAHNAAVAAADTAAAIRADIASGPSLWEDPGFERGRGGVPGPAAGGLYPGRIERTEEWSSSGGWSVKYIASGTGGNNYGSYGYGAIVPNRWYAVTATVHGGDVEQQWNTTWDVRTAPDSSGDLLAYVISGNDGKITVGPGETITKSWVFRAPENGTGFRFWAGQTSAYNKAENVGQVVYLDDFRLVDVTDSYPALLEAQAAAAAAAERAEEAYALADGKPDMDDVEVAIETSANGKNSITVSSAAPTVSTPGVVAGDTWWRVDGDGVIFAQYRWTGSAWSPVTVRSEVIASLDVGKLVVTGSSRFTEAVVDRLFADLFTAHKITAEQITIAALDENGDLAPGSVGAITLQDGIVGADKIIADEVAVAVADLVKARVENLVVTDGATINEAVILKLAAEMITAGVLRTAEAGQRVVIDETGIVMIGVDADGIEFELVRIGPAGDNLITAGDTMISPAGVQAPNGTFDDLTVGGESLPAILEAYPRGIVGFAHTATNSAWHGDGSEIRRLEVNVTVQPGRRYRVTLDQHYIETRGGAAGVTWVERLKYGSPGSMVEFATSRAFLAASTADQTIPALVGYIETGGLASDEDWTIGFTTQGPSRRDIRLKGKAEARLRLSVEDIGRTLAATGESLMTGGTSVEGAEAPPPPDPPKVKRYTKTYTSTGFRTYDNNGSQTSDQDVVQGLYAGGSSSRLRKGGWLFPSMTGDLSGATVEKVEAYIYMNHSYYTAGATVNPCVWGGIMRDNLSTFTQVTGWKRNTGKWFTLPSSLYAGFKSGTYAGVGVKPTNTFAEQYARFDGSGAKIRITYTK